MACSLYIGWGALGFLTGRPPPPLFETKKRREETGSMGPLRNREPISSSLGGPR